MAVGHHLPLPGAPGTSTTLGRAILGLLLALVVACKPGLAGGVSVPAPVTEDLHPAVRRFLEAERENVFSAPDRAAVWGRYGMALHAHGLLDDALPCYRQAAVLAPISARWPYLEGLVLERLGAPASEVLERLDASARLDARYPLVHLRRGALLAREGRRQEALEAFDAAVALDGSLAAVTEAVAQGAGNPVTVPDPLLTLVEDLSHTPEKCLERGLAAVAGGRAGEAREDLEIAVAEFPDDGRAHEGLGFALLSLGEHAAALEELMRATHILGTGVERHRAMARCHIALGKPEFAGLLLERAIELDPQDASLLGERARCHATEGNLEKAYHSFAAAGELGELPPDLLMAWGTVAWELEHLEEAREHYLKAEELVPGNLEVLYGLGLIEEELGLLDSASERYRAVLMRQTDHPAGQRLAAIEDARQ
jgi:tetratricopeptide (TPR) repeat protein